jgi:DMSO reductase iron-sulfur subunit
MTERNAFIVDLNRCTGCHACETACQIANGVSGELRWRRVRTFNELHVHGVEVSHLSLACNHCASAPCMDGCPARAVYRDEATGAVLIDPEACIGCRYCAWACPYGAPRFDEGRGVMVKCDFCVERLRAGRRPACVSSCPTGALDWGSLPAERLVHAAPGMAEAAADPSIRIVPLEPQRSAPRQTEPPATPPWRSLATRIAPQITLAREWPLAVFTLLLSALVGVFLATLLGAPAPEPASLVGAGVAALLLSASHLGRKTRAWRAALHADRSWLSREIAMFIAFLVLVSMAFFLGPAPVASDGPAAHALNQWSHFSYAMGGAATARLLGCVAAALGAAALIAADRVYRFARIRGAGPLHSAHPLLTGLLLAAAWAAASGTSGAAETHTALWTAAAAATALAALKGVLYALRKRHRSRMELPGLNRATGIRLGLLAAGAAALWWGPSHAAAFTMLLASELVDRAEYYDEMEIRTPESLMFEELRSRLR